jgi:hypothetical protein
LVSTLSGGQISHLVPIPEDQCEEALMGLLQY